MNNWFIDSIKIECSFEVHSYSEMGGGWNPVESLLGDFRVIKIFINVNQFKEIWKSYKYSSWRRQIFDGKSKIENLK